MDRELQAGWPFHARTTMAKDRILVLAAFSGDWLFEAVWLLEVALREL
jgi:hypothetical protein